MEAIKAGVAEARQGEANQTEARAPVKRGERRTKCTTAASCRRKST